MKLSQSFAFTRGRSYVLPDDAAAVFAAVVGHRLILKQEARLSRVAANDILTEIRRSVEVPYVADRSVGDAR